MCIGSNWVNEAQDLIYVTKFCDLPNKQNPTTDHLRVTKSHLRVGEGILSLILVLLWVTLGLI